MPVPRNLSVRVVTAIAAQDGGAQARQAGARCRDPKAAAGSLEDRYGGGAEAAKVVEHGEGQFLFLPCQAPVGAEPKHLFAEHEQFVICSRLSHGKKNVDLVLIEGGRQFFRPPILKSRRMRGCERAKRRSSPGSIVSAKS